MKTYKFIIACKIKTVEILTANDNCFPLPSKEFNEKEADLNFQLRNIRFF